MSEYVIENDVLKVTVNSKGCELSSVVRKSDNNEYMWDAKPDIWKRHAPVLFPVVGKYKNDSVKYEGKDYHLTQHGFARDMEFTLVSKESDEIVMKLEENEDTLTKYPFKFRLECGFKLEENSIKVSWKVVNTNDKEMYFSIGGHPAFVRPAGKGSLAGAEISFDTSEKSVNYKLLNADGLVEDKVYELPLTDGRAVLTEEMFNNDALIFENSQSGRVSLSDEGKTFVTVEFDAPVFGVWAPVNKKVPFVCIEPWYGRADGADFNGELKNREWGNTLEAAETFDKSYKIIFG